MVKCLECGFEGARLQWTHFKFNCTGRFQNGEEYKRCYPKARIIDDELARSTAVTLENFIKKYGNIEGTERWNNYKHKQAHSNSFEYKQEKYGWSKEQFDEYNSSRSQTLEKMIQRYGEVEGVEKWTSYCERQAYTNTKEYFIEKYGPSLGYEKYLEINKNKSVSNPSILASKMGITTEEATEIIISRQKNFFTSNLEKEFIALLEANIGKLDHTSNYKPFGKWSPDLNSYVVYDIKHNNLVIEFNGDYWHANPKIYNKDAVIRGKKVVDIWHKDMLKLKTATDSGFQTYVVWELEFKTNKEDTIKEVVKWILKEQKLKK